MSTLQIVVLLAVVIVVLVVLVVLFSLWVRDERRLRAERDAELMSLLRQGAVTPNGVRASIGLPEQASRPPLGTGRHVADPWANVPERDW